MCMDRRYIEYKGYTASYNYDANVMEYYGVVKKENDIIHFHASTIKELIKAFHDSVNAHVEMSQEFNRKI